MADRLAVSSKKSHKRLPTLRSPAERNQLVIQNLPLIYYCVNQLSTQQRVLGKETCVRLGEDALIRAGDTWDVNRGVKFCTYAAHWIKGVIRAAAYDAMYPRANGGSKPKTFVTTDSEACEIAIQQATARSTEDAEKMEEDRDRAYRILTLVPFKWRKAMELRFVDGWTLQQIGDQLGITKERARQIVRDATRLLREKLRGQPTSQLLLA